MPDQTPEQAAAAALAAEGYAAWYRPYQEQVLETLTAAIRTDREARSQEDALRYVGVDFREAHDDEGEPSLFIPAQHVPQWGA